MKTPTRLRWFKYRIFLPLLTKLPLTIAYYLIAKFGRYYFNTYQKNWVNDYQKGIEKAFANTSQIEQQYWVKRHLEMMAKEELDVYHLKKMTSKNYQKWVSFDFSQITHDECPKLFLIGHANRTILLSAMGLAGFPAGVLTTGVDENPALDTFTKDYLNSKMNNAVKNMGGEWIKTTQGPRAVYRQLSQNKSLVIAIDIPGPSTMSFLKGQLHLETKVDRIAKKTKASCYYLQLTDDPKNNHTLKVKAIKLDQSKASMAEQAIELLEQDIKIAPWIWWQWNAFEHIWKKTDE